MKMQTGIMVLLALLGSLLGAEKEGVRKANRLAKEKSPYLLLHAANPVNWYPWGEEAFKKAREEKKLILLSVGYSTCHWCHVMERESFEDEKIAAFLNEHFVSIKLDREERPDVDQIYMTALQAMTGQGGGWPLNMFLTPDLKPLFGGTYSPPVDRDGQPGFMTILNKLQGHWSADKDGVAKQVADGFGQMQGYFKELHESNLSPQALNKKLIVEAIVQSAQELDPIWGGFGQGEKFPQVSALRAFLQCGDEEERKAVISTCRRMLDGGIHDQVGGGFHRYAVDREWQIPHFEKMLYDQAQMIELYLDLWQLTGEEDFRQAVKGTADYVLSQLRHPEGGFYCAQDAQSEGKEGKYFCWTVSELESLLSDQEMEVACKVLGVTEQGNFFDHSDPQALLHQNVLYYKTPRAELDLGQRKTAEAILARLAKVRSERVLPATDDKILASWNGLMIAALARGGRVLDEEKYLEAAKKAHRFVKENLWSKNEGLSHRWREGAKDGRRQASSEMYFISGTRALYEATLDPAYLSFANHLAGEAVKAFYDAENGGFFQSEDRADIVMRLKGQFDGAMPTESSVAAREFGILGEMTGNKDYREIARKTVLSYVPLIEQGGVTGMGMMLKAADYLMGKHGRLVIAGENGREELLQVAAKVWEPNRITLAPDGALDEFTKGLKPMKGKATAYYCVGQKCQLPVTSAEKLEAQLKRIAAASKK